MTVFGSDKSRGVKIWGPTAGVEVRVDALGSVVDKTWVLESVSVGAREIVDVRQCFNDVSFIYALGNSQANCAINLTFVIYIGKCSGGDGTQSITDGLKQYVGSRISKSTDPKLISIGKFSRMGWLTGVEVGQAEPAKGVCRGTVSFIMELDK